MEITGKEKMSFIMSPIDYQPPPPSSPPNKKIIIYGSTTQPLPFKKYSWHNTIHFIATAFVSDINRLLIFPCVHYFLMIIKYSWNRHEVKRKEEKRERYRVTYFNAVVELEKYVYYLLPGWFHWSLLPKPKKKRVGGMWHVGNYFFLSPLVSSCPKKIMFHKRRIKWKIHNLIYPNAQKLTQMERNISLTGNWRVSPIHTVEVEITNKMLNGVQVANIQIASFEAKNQQKITFSCCTVLATFFLEDLTFFKKGSC